VDLSAILDWHRAHYPRLQAADIYKLLHQGVFGPGHSIRSPARARAALKQELARLMVRPGQPEIEPLDPAGLLVRVNLAALPRNETAVRQLLHALLETAAAVRGTPAVMRQRLAAAVRWCYQTLPGQADRLKKLAYTTSLANFPARHHSPIYLATYHPAYRVILRRHWPLGSDSPPAI